MGRESYSDLWLMIAPLVVVGLSTTELVPSFIRNELIRPYVTKVWPCILVWLTICYEMICLDFSKKMAAGN